MTLFVATAHSIAPSASQRKNEADFQSNTWTKPEWLTHQNTVKSHCFIIEHVNESFESLAENERWNMKNRKSPMFVAFLLCHTSNLPTEKKYMLCLSFVRGRRQFRGVAEARKKKNKVFDAVINSFLNDKHCPFHTEIEVNRRTVKQTNWLSKEFYHFVNRSLLRIFAFISEKKNRDRKNRRWHDSTLTDFRR